MVALLDHYKGKTRLIIRPNAAARVLHAAELFSVDFLELALRNTISIDNYSCGQSAIVFASKFLQMRIEINQKKVLR